MNAQLILTAAQVILKLIQLGPTIIKDIEDTKPFVLALYKVMIKGEKVTDADLDALESEVDRLSAALQIDLPDDT